MHYPFTLAEQFEKEGKNPRKTKPQMHTIVKKMLMLHKVLYHTFGICTINEA